MGCHGRDLSLGRLDHSRRWRSRVMQTISSSVPVDAEGLLVVLGMEYLDGSFFLEFGRNSAHELGTAGSPLSQHHLEFVEQGVELGP